MNYNTKRPKKISLQFDSVETGLDRTVQSYMASAIKVFIDEKIKIYYNNIIHILFIY